MVATSRWLAFGYRLVLALFVLVSMGTMALAEPPHHHPASQPATEPAGKKEITANGDHLIVTDHQITVAGQPIDYQATAGTLLMKDEAGKPRANFFFVAYCRKGVADLSKRPITFVFNGGPGAAAVWLHMGALGPQRIVLNEDGNATRPPHAIAENPNTWLDVTDLVFIDPVSTGYSRAAEGVNPQDFFGVQQDVTSVAEFIRVYINRNQRWNSPKYLAGESYGTTRAAALSRHLLDADGIDLNGIVFISTVLDFRTLSFRGANDLGYVVFLPSYAAIAWYHKKLDPALQQQDVGKLVDEVKEWALATYVPALARGADLPADQRQAIAKTLARYTGLSAEYIERSNLRVESDRFRKQLLADRGKVIGRFDSRLAGDAMDPIADNAEYDPGFPGILATYTATFQDYARRELHFESDLKYEVLSGRVGPWSSGRDGAFSGYLNVADDLRSAMIQNPHMKVFFVSGYFDLATPLMGTDYTLSHLDLSNDLRANVTRAVYPGGHMVYHNNASLAKLKQDVAGFINRGEK